MGLTSESKPRLADLPEATDKLELLLDPNPQLRSTLRRKISGSRLLLVSTLVDTDKLEQLPDPNPLLPSTLPPLILESKLRLVSTLADTDKLVLPLDPIRCSRVHCHHGYWKASS